MENLTVITFIGVVGLAFAHMQLRWKFNRLKSDQAAVWQGFNDLRSAVNELARKFFPSRPPPRPDKPPAVTNMHRRSTKG